MSVTSERRAKHPIASTLSHRSILTFTILHFGRGHCSYRRKASKRFLVIKKEGCTSNGYKRKLPMNNFESITESSEKLAVFISENFGYCGGCPADPVCRELDDEACCFDGIFAWLQEECDE